MPSRLAPLAVLLVLVLSSCAPAVSRVVAPALTAPAVSTAELPAYDVVGVASWYGPGFAGRLTASGDVFDPGELTAAHRTLPFGTQVRVTNLENGLHVVVRINDRGPFKAGRIIDLSRAAAERIGMIGSGTARVRVEPLVPGAEVTVAPDDSLRRYEAVVRGRRRGELLLLTSPQGGPVLVRVVGNEPADVSVHMLLSRELLNELGPSISIRASSAD